MPQPNERFAYKKVLENKARQKFLTSSINNIRLRTEANYTTLTD